MVRLKHHSLLVTGGTGLVGSHVIEALLPYQPCIIVPIRSFHPRSYFATQKLHRQVIRAPVDLTNYRRVVDLLIKYQVVYVIHLAAQALVESAFHNPLETLHTNIMGTVNILEAARQSPYIKGIILASSDKAYGKLSKNRYQETDPLQGDHPYEVSKASADLIAQMYAKTYQLPLVITRFGNIYGPGDLNFDRLIPDICRSIIQKRILKIRSDGSFRRDYLYVKDVVGAYVKILQYFPQIKGEVFNFGSPDNLSVWETIKLTQKILHQKIRYRVLNTQKNEIPYQSLRYSKAKRLLNWQPKFRFDQALLPTFSWYQNYFKS